VHARGRRAVMRSKPFTQPPLHFTIVSAKGNRKTERNVEYAQKVNIYFSFYNKKINETN
jgi:hypothetical protein